MKPITGLRFVEKEVPVEDKPSFMTKKKILQFQTTHTVEEYGKGRWEETSAWEDVPFELNP